jgi:hypothetical protein
MMSGKNRMVVLAATLAVVAVLGSAAVSLAQRNAAAKANGEYNTGFWNSQSSQSGSNYGWSQNSQNRQSYSYDPSDNGDVAAKGPSCAPKLNSQPADQSSKQAQKQQNRRSYSQQPSNQSSKSAQSDVAARGPSCGPKLNYKAADQSSDQAQNQQNRRSYSHEPSMQSDSGNQNWNQSQQGSQEPWKYQKTDPRRYQN